MQVQFLADEREASELRKTDDGGIPMTLRAMDNVERDVRRHITEFNHFTGKFGRLGTMKNRGHFQLDLMRRLPVKGENNTKLQLEVM